MKLPDEFINRMNEVFLDNKTEAEAFFSSFEKEPLKGIRLNRMKTPNSSYNDVLNCLGIEEINPVPWCDGGFYCTDEGNGRDPYYHAGVFYPQEPSAMLPAQILSAKPGDNVLDLCAAPGGKACRLGEDLNGEGLLVANEINADRAKALLRNIERTGITNSVILNETPEHIASRLPLFFNKILTDVPCSGEGMFRRDPSAVKSWEKFGPEVCIAMQKDILESTHAMLATGGELVYSTCTFCYGEDEGQILDFISRHPEYEVIAHPEIKGVTHATENDPLPGSMRIWPHKANGDGHFCVHLRKNPVSETTIEEEQSFRNRNFSFAFRKRTDNYSFTKSREAMNDFLSELLLPEAFERFKALSAPGFVVHNNKVHIVTVNEKLFDRLKVVKMGHFPGEIKETTYGRIFVPSHCLAISLNNDELMTDSVLRLNRDDPRLIRYLKGETITLSDEEALVIKKRGTVVIAVDRYPLGFGKLSGDMSVKNLYPKAWRLN